MTTLKERAIATHAAVVAEREREQERADKERREARCRRLNSIIKEDLFFVPDLDPTVRVPTFRTRNILHGDVRTTETTFDVVTDGSVDIGIASPRAGGSGDTYALLTPCASGCGQRVATTLGFYARAEEDEDEAFAQLVELIGRALAKADDTCLDCQWCPCPHCGHIR